MSSSVSEVSPAASQPALGWHRLLDWRPGSVWARVAIVLLLVAPIAIAGTMMWAMWDPSKYMRDIQLAVVNEDTGVESRGEYTNYGDQIVEGLLKTEYLNFTETSAAQAQEGLTRGTYMMVVTIPQVFSEQAVTIISDNPVRPEIEFATNDYYGTNSSVITASLIPQVQSKVENAITKKYSDKVIAGVTKLSDGLTRAAEGATKLDEGAAKLQDGGKRAVEGIAKLDDGASQLADGSGRLADGMDTLVAGTGRLADGAAQIEGGVTQLTDMLIPLLNQAGQATPQLVQAEQALRAAGMTEQANKVRDIATRLDPANAANMASQLAKLRDGTALLHENLADPNSQYLGGMLKLQDGAHQLDAGIGRLSDGTSQLRTGGGTLADGLNQLKDGTAELSSKLVDGAATAPKIAKPDISAQNMAVPINFTTSNAHPVQTVQSKEDPTDKKITGGVSMLLVQVFGFLIMLLLSLILPYYYGRGTRTGLTVLSAWAVKAVANFVALVGLALISQLLGWQPATWATIIPVLAVTAAAGAAVYQLLQVIFGRAVGGGFGLAFYALGVMVFGGVWPVNAIPAFLRFFHFIHPLTYAKTAFIRATDGIHDSSYWTPLGVLVALTVIALALSIAVLHARRTGQATLLRGQEKLTLSDAPAV